MPKNDLTQTPLFFGLGRPSVIKLFKLLTFFQKGAGGSTQKLTFLNEISDKDKIVREKNPKKLEIFI